MVTPKRPGKGPVLSIAGLGFLLLNVFIFLPTNAAASGTFDAAADFSATSNPNGMWSYGWSTTRGSAFNMFTTAVNYAGLDFWQQPTQSLPAVFHNGTTSSQRFGCCNPMQPGTLAVHPGPLGENAIVRWTAPAAGKYSVQATYLGLDAAGSTTDVAVLANGTQLYAGEVTGYLTSQTFSGTISAAAGTVVDFTVGFGTDGNYYSDTTGVSATITLLNTNPLAGLSPADAAALLAGEPISTAAAQLAVLDPATALQIALARPQLGAQLLAAMDPSAAVSILLTGVPATDSGQGDSLFAMLTAAKAALSNGHTTAACASLKNFVRQLQQQSGDGLPVDKAAFLLQSATAVQKTLGCKDPAPADPKASDPTNHTPAPPAHATGKPDSNDNSNQQSADGGTRKHGLLFFV